MTTTETNCCPMCRHAGEDGRPHELQTIEDLWRCGRCDWMFRVTKHGAEHWLDPWRAGRNRKKRRRR